MSLPAARDSANVSDYCFSGATVCLQLANLGTCGSTDVIGIPIGTQIGIPIGIPIGVPAGIPIGILIWNRCVMPDL